MADIFQVSYLLLFQENVRKNMRNSENIVHILLKTECISFGGSEIFLIVSVRKTLSGALRHHLLV